MQSQAPEQESPARWSSDQIAVTIVNNSGGSLVYNTSSTTGGHLSTPVTTIGNGSTVLAFTGQGETGLPEGCGGSVKYNLPNNADVLILLYNIDDSADFSYCIPLLQNGNGKEAGADTYYCVLGNGVGSGQSRDVTVTINQIQAAG